MTASITPAQPLRSRSGALSAYVGAKAQRLQAAYLERSRGDHSTAVSALARLRRAIATATGSDPGIWDLLFDGFPAELIGVRDEPSRAEQAAQAALTLYAVHQQSQNSGMHVAGQSLGTAVGNLARELAAGRDVGADPGVVRRFQALGTAASFNETLYHARGLVTQLRGAQIGMDYGRFAADLYRLQNPARGNAVRLKWGRDFYRIRPEKSPDATTRAGAGTPESLDLERQS